MLLNIKRRTKGKQNKTKAEVYNDFSKKEKEKKQRHEGGHKSPGLTQNRLPAQTRPKKQKQNRLERMTTQTHAKADMRQTRA